MDIKEKIEELDFLRDEYVLPQEKKELRQGYKEHREQLRQEYREQRNKDDQTKQEQKEQKEQLKQEHKEQKEQLKQEYREQKEKIKELREAAMTNLKGRIRNNMSGTIRVLVVALLVFMQFGLIIILPMFLRQYSIYFYLILEVCSFILAVTLANAGKNSSFKVAWMSVALLFPISGHIMFYLWGRKKPRRRIREYAEAAFAKGQVYLSQDKDANAALYEIVPAAKRMSKYMCSEKFPLYRNNDLRYYSMGEHVFKDMFEDMLTAKKFLLVNFYIVAEGDIWDMLHEIMLLKVSEGVEVLFLYDDFGAVLRTDKHFADRLNEEGIKTKVFNPIYKYTDKVILNSRSHQKIVVIDGEIGYTGGINLADEYANLIQRFGVWKDCGIRVEGDAVWGLSMTFLQMWSICSPGIRVPYMKYKSERVFEKNNCFCHVISDGPMQSEDIVIESVYRQIVADADEKVYIMTPYLILEEHMLQTLLEAVKRGVDVRIITPNIPDKKSVKLLTNYNYGPLLEGGVRIFEYTPGFIHSKVIMNEFCGCVGTVNMDYRSFYLNYENAVWVSDPGVLGDIELDFKETFNISEEITYKMWLDRPFKDRIIQPVLKLLSTLA
ncbi:MAG: cardiolipin synthase [Lachnospiraceae bacterium]|nr:cardiolipin synthase [Lachnospiraceae bacterium]